MQTAILQEAVYRSIDHFLGLNACFANKVRTDNGGYEMHAIIAFNNSDTVIEACLNELSNVFCMHGNQL